MSYSINPQIRTLNAPPIAAVQDWVKNRQFSPERPLLDVSQAVPSYGPPDSLLDNLANDLHQLDTAQYTDILGLPALREALANHLTEDYAGDVIPAQIAITTGCNQAFCLAMDVVAQPGDEVLLLLPYYFNHHMWLQMRGIRSRLVPFSRDERALADSIASAIRPATRAIALVTPNNPTGIEYSPEFMDTVFELARKSDIALVVDETYKDFRQDPGAPHRLLQRPDWDRHLIQLFSFSKSYAMTGYRVGAMSARPAVLGEVEKIIDNVTICPSHIGQLAALYGLRHLSDWRQSKAAMLKQRVRRLRDSFADGELRYELVSSGAYFAYVRHPFDGESAEAVAHRLADRFDILCLPGPMFGPDQQAFMRFAFANLDSERIPELIRRLAESQMHSG